MSIHPLNILHVTLTHYIIGEFQRAVKICTGASLSQHVVRTVFLIFDQDGDGRLSDREFIAIMRDRIHRGLQVQTTIYSYLVGTNLTCYKLF